LDLLLEAVSGADDHVVHEAAGEPVQRPALALVVGPLHDEGVAVLAHSDGARDGARQLAPRALHADGAVDDGDVDAARNGDGCLPDSTHPTLTTRSRGPRRRPGARAPRSVVRP